MPPNPGQPALSDEQKASIDSALNAIKAAEAALEKARKELTTLKEKSGGGVENPG